MKNCKSIYIISILLWLIGQPCVAQSVEDDDVTSLPFWGGLYNELPVGSVKLSSLSLEEKGDSLHLSMTLYVVSKAINDFQSWTILPELRLDEETSYLFPHVLINGKQKERLYQRKLAFKNKRLLSHLPYIKEKVHPRKGKVVFYTFSLPYQSWMDEASFSLHQILVSCNEQDQWFSLWDIARVKMDIHPPYVANVQANYIEPRREEKIREVAGEAYLDFQSGKSVILPDFRRNPVELEKINTSLREVIENPDVLVRELKVEGYASPEGSFSTNQQLSYNRAMALRNYLKDKFSLSSQLFDVSSVGEDWQGLRSLVEDSFLSGKDNILSIIDGPADPDRKEQQLKTLGSTYQQLLRDYFPQLRRVSYSISYSIRDYTAEEAESLMQKNPGHLSCGELFIVAGIYPSDSEKWHEVMQLSVLLYPDDPVALINAGGSRLMNGDLEGAWKYLSAVQDDLRAWNNIGAYYLALREAEKAEFYLNRAVVNTKEITSHNLSELEKLKEDLAREERRKNR